VQKIDQYFSEVMNAILHIDRSIVEGIVQAIKDSKPSMIFVVGNGGSATTASHFAGDLFKTCRINARCPVDSNYLVTAYGNDIGYDRIFSEQLINNTFTDDLLIVISGSGRSPNIIEAVEVAKKQGLKTIGLTGFDGGLLKNLCDICLIVPSDHMEVIEDAHLAICHCIVNALKES